MRLSDKIILITDAGTPLGKAAAAAFTKEGAVVVAPEAVIAKTDIDKIVSDTLVKYGRIDVLAYSHDELIKSSVENSSDEQFERMILVNAKTAFLYTQAVGRAMKDAHGGNIIYFGSIHSEKPTGSAFAYSAAKAAVKMLCKEAALDLGIYNIRANIIEVGGLKGDEERFAGTVSPLYVDMTGKIPGGRPGSAEDAAKVSVFLASEDSVLLNGADIRADGALTLKYMPRVTYEEFDDYKAGKRAPSELKFFNLNDQSDRPRAYTGDNNKSLINKVAVVTGSASGIGQGIALALAERGAKLVVTAHSRPADETMQLIRDAGGEAICVKGDFSSLKDVKNLFAEASTAFGKVDILVNNAALQINKWLLEATEEEFDLLMSTNLKGYWMCTKEAIPYMKRAECGRIINIASIHAKRPTDFDVTYSMTKAGIKMLTRESALELAQYGIMVNMVSLGGVKIQQKSGNPSWKPPGRYNLGNMPKKGYLCGRAGYPEDVGWIAAFLADERSQYITGSNIRADGGTMMI
ncbi:MAG: SDR family oxidoreductase [Clostridiales bacterium]|jgi:glucose 1-dehydrogenase|nr:SDR family oxidoreductase [Clostridiales bacterium]